MNRDIDAARHYHQRTKHSVASLQAQPHYLDWEIKPRLFKVYPSLDAIPLPRELPPARLAALAAIASKAPVGGDTKRIPDLPSLARVLHFAGGITRKKVLPDGAAHYFRAAACTGALYHVDLYVTCADLPGLAAGVYHFGPHDFALYQLRAGDYRSVLVEATGAEPFAQHAPLIITCASTYWRNSWKYRTRAYRHCFWDTGTLLANLLAVAAADGLPTRLLYGFVDDTVSRLIGLDPAREAPVALVAVGHAPQAALTPRPAVPALSPETLPLSSREIDYPAIREIQAASSLQAPDEVRAWRAGPALCLGEPMVSGQLVPLQAVDDATLPPDTIDEVILRRGSTRHFARESIERWQLSAILDRATGGVSNDIGVSACGDVYLIVHAVEGLPAGTYVYHRDQHALEVLRTGHFRREAGYLGLWQELPADAAVNIYVLCNLDPVLRRFGNRGYRIAQLEAAITGGKIYLASYALRLGATGLTFFDDEVTEFFCPHGAGKAVMFLVAVGRGRKALAGVR
jgi:SagB-type dehydrogenase family enzyme